MEQQFINSTQEITKISSRTTLKIAQTRFSTQPRTAGNPPSIYRRCSHPGTAAPSNRRALHRRPRPAFPCCCSCPLPPTRFISQPNLSQSPHWRFFAISHCLQSPNRRPPRQSTASNCIPPPLEPD